MGRQIYLPQQSIVAKTTKTTTVKISKRFRHWDPGHILQLLFANLYEKQTEVNTDCQQRELCAESLSRVQLFATPWTVAHQAPPSMEFSRQEYWSGFPFPSPGDLPDPGIKPRSPALQADALPSETPGNLNN